MDYFHINVIFAWIAIIRMFVALTSIYEFNIHQMDAKMIFLNGIMDKNINVKLKKDLL